MIITNKIEIDLCRRGVEEVIDAVQGDENSREIAISLINNGEDWPIPEGTTVMIGYCRLPGRSGGNYDTLKGGTAAYRYQGNELSIVLAPQVLVAPGKVELSVAMVNGGRSLHTFTIGIMVHKNPGLNIDAPDPEPDAYQQLLKSYALLSNRVTNLATLEDGSTTGDAELMDIRVGHDGTTYANAGEAVRKQIEAVQGAIDELEQNSGTGGGLTETASALLITILRNGVYSTDQSANITALENALTSGGGEEPDFPDEPDTPVVTLTRISATYSGGDVTVGTTVADLTGIVVTAHYSDGTSKAVTGYTLSGEIAEGENTITVSYQGKTATFTVVGVAESPGGFDWVSGAEVAYTLVDGEWAKPDGSFVPYDGYSRTDYIYCYGAGHIYHSVARNAAINVLFYDIGKNLIYADNGYDAWNVVPENAAYAVVSYLTEQMSSCIIKLYKKVDPTWTDGEAYSFTFVENEYVINSDGAFATYSGWKRTDYVNCVGVSKITKTNASQTSQYGAFYNAEKEYMVGCKLPDTTNGVADISVPVGACYFTTSDTNANMDALVLVPHS